MELVYILVEDHRRVIVVSDSFALCDYFRSQLIQLYGNQRELNIYRVDKYHIMLGSALSFDMWYRNNGGQ